MIEDAIANLDFNELFNIKNDGDCQILTFKKLSKRLIIYDPGFYHTAMCWSRICKIDINDGKLYYRGIPVEEKAKTDFLEVAYDLIFGEQEKLDRKEYFIQKSHHYFYLIPEIKNVLDNLPYSIHPMDFLSIGVISLKSIENNILDNSNDFVEKSAFLIAQVGIISSYYHIRKNKAPWNIKELNNQNYSTRIINQISNFDVAKTEKLGKILNTIMILHAEHGQNCSSATVRNIASAKGDLYNAVSCGMAAFNGQLHGGASQYVSEMYEYLLATNMDVNEYVDQKIKNKKPLMGFGQRTYNKIFNCWDPRVEKMYEILQDPEFDFEEIREYRNLANKLINRVVNDPYFIERNITPNPDLFNCIFYKLFGVENAMNPMMLSLGRISGWISNYYEHVIDKMPLTRPCDIHIES